MRAAFGLALALAASVACADLALAADPATPKPAAADWREADPENTLVIDTNKGRIVIELTPVSAPQAVDRIKTLTRQHFYDGRTFFRVIDDFMDQTGDPQDTGMGGSTLPNVPGEFGFKRKADDTFVTVSRMPGAEGGFAGALPVASQPSAMAMLTNDGTVSAFGMFCSGVLGMARASGPDTANSQFFIMRHDYMDLNQHYAALGRVVAGEDVVRQIKTGEPVEAPQDKMLHVSLLADMPANTRPKVRMIDTHSAYFTALIAQARADHGEAFSPCDIDVPGEVK